MQQITVMDAISNTLTEPSKDKQQHRLTHWLPEYATCHPDLHSTNLHRLASRELVIGRMRTVCRRYVDSALRETGRPRRFLRRYQLSGFVTACALIRPTGIEGMKVKSVRKKVEQPLFAAKVHRGQLDRAIAELKVASEHIVVSSTCSPPRRTCWN